MDESKTPQQVFDETYISATEICKRLSVTRSAVTNAEKRQLLPTAIRVDQGGGYLCLWVREQVHPILDAWGICLAARKRSKVEQTA